MCGLCLQAYLQESIANSNANAATLDNGTLDEGHVTGSGRDDVEAALSGTTALTNAALQVSKITVVYSVVDMKLKACIRFLIAVLDAPHSPRGFLRHHFRILDSSGWMTAVPRWVF